MGMVSRPPDTPIDLPSKWLTSADNLVHHLRKWALSASCQTLHSHRHHASYKTIHLRLQICDDLYHIFRLVRDLFQVLDKKLDIFLLSFLFG